MEDAQEQRSCTRRRPPRQPPSFRARLRMGLATLAAIPLGIGLEVYLLKYYTPWECLAIAILGPIAISVILLGISGAILIVEKVYRKRF